MLYGRQQRLTSGANLNRSRGNQKVNCHKVTTDVAGRPVWNKLQLCFLEKVRVFSTDTYGKNLVLKIKITTFPGDLPLDSNQRKIYELGD